MNIEDYISSGILETYLLGLAGEEEARDLEQLCLQYPELNVALQETERTLEKYAQLHAILPPVNSKEAIWSAIQHATPSEEAKPQTGRKGITSLYPYITAAAVLLVVIGLPYHFYKMKAYKEEISTLQQEKVEILVQNKNFQARLKQASDEVGVLASTKTKNIILAGVAGHEQAQASLFLTDNKELFINARSLEKLPENQQYQVWGIVKGKPVSAGLIDQTKDGALQEMTLIENAELYAVTIEKQGGSEQPTLSQMVVAGKPL